MARSPTPVITAGARTGGRGEAWRPWKRLALLFRYPDLEPRDAEFTAHTEFRKKLNDRDVVPDAHAAAPAMM